MYTFIIISYNEEKYILEALESIRYQIDNYGKGRSYQLIIADDNSMDNTKVLVDKWLLRYNELFADVTKIYQKENVGTCKNIADAMREIKGTIFFSTAGDDLISPVDVFTVLEQNSDVDVLANIPLMMTNGEIDSEKKKYKDALAQITYTSKYINWSVALGCPIQAGASWNKRLNTDRVLSFMEIFRLLDDRPRYYAIWRYEAPVKYKFINVPLLIYRKNENSVTQLKGKHHSAINKDLISFYDTCERMEKNLLYKLCIHIQRNFVKFRVSGIIGYLRYISPYYIVEQIRRLHYRKKSNIIFEEFRNKYINSATEYYKSIHKSAIKVGNYNGH